MTDTATETTPADVSDATPAPPVGEAPAPVIAEPTPSPAPQQPEDDEDLPITLRAARELRREHQQLRRDIDAAHAARETAEKRLAEVEPLVGRLGELQGRLRETQVRADVASVAPTLGFANPDDALLFIRDRIEVAEDGSTNARALLESLAAEKPYLLNTPRSIATGAVTNVARQSEPSSVLELDGLDPVTTARHLARLAATNLRK